jgi:hypothetical protein
LPVRDGTRNQTKMVDTSFTMMNWGRGLKDSKEFL